MHGNQNFHKELLVFCFQWQCKTIDNTENMKKQDLILFKKKFFKKVFLSQPPLGKIIYKIIYGKAYTHQEADSFCTESLKTTCLAGEKNRWYITFMLF